MTDEDTNLARAMRAVEEVNQAAGDDPVEIGILTPLTGPGDPVAGELITRGACLGADYLRERGGVRGGRQVRFVLQNDQASAAEEGFPRSSVGGLAKLAVVDGVLAVVGQWHLRTAPWVAEAAERLGVPIFIENGHNTMTAHQRRTLFRTYFSIADRTPLILRFWAENGIRRVAILASNTVFGATTADTLQEFAARPGNDFEILRFDFDQETTTSVRDELKQVKSWGPDVLMNAGVVRTNYMVIEQAAEAGLLPGIAHTVSFAFPMRSDDYWRLSGGEPGNGVVWASTYYRPSWPGLTEIGRWFTERYLAKYGSFPPDNALNAFTDVTIIGQALDLAESDGRQDLLVALELHPFETWRGPVSFGRRDDHWHHSPPDLVLMQYQHVGQSFDDAAIVYPPEVSTGPYAPPRG